MRRRPLGLTIANVALYTVGALVIFLWLTVRASNGALFSGGAPSYSVLLPSAPAIEPSKSDVLTAAGVEVGVVAGLEAVDVDCPEDEDTCVRVDFRVTGDVTLRKDAAAEVVVKNIVGEKALMVHVGEDGERAERGALIAFAGQSSLVEPDEALQPIADATDIVQDPELKAFVDEQTVVFDGAAEDAEAVVAAAERLVKVLADQKQSLDALGRRSSELLSALAARGDDIEVAMLEAATLAAEVERLLDGQLDVVSEGFRLAADALTVLAQRQAEVHDVLQRLPYIADLASEVTDETNRLLRNERGHFVWLGVYEIPTLTKMLQILEEADR